jgi:SAM-dependent methyltransferase
MNKPTLYLNLCTEFFDLDKPVASLEEYAFFYHYLSQAQGPILEPMCGSGRYLIPYLQEGFDVEGFDASPFMIKALHDKCAQKGLQPKVWEQFLEDVPTTKQYNLIFIPDSSFCLFLDLAHIKTCLQKIYALLEKGGTFVFDVETVYAVPDKVGVWQGKAYKKDNGNVIMCSTLPLPIENNIATVICRYELIDKTDIIKTEMEYFQIKLYHPMEMDALLKDVGFSRIKKVAAHDHTATPSAYDYTIVYECMK